jgi:integrase
VAIDESCKRKHRDDLVFPGVDGYYMRRPQTGKNRVSCMDAAVQVVDVPRLTIHDLRHSAGSFAVSGGANVIAVQRMLGYSSVAMIPDEYAGLFNDDLNAVAIALDAAASK